MKHNYTFKRTLSALLLLLVSTMSWAYDFEAGGIYYNINDDWTSVSVTSGDSEYSGDIVIPSTVTNSGKTYSVTGIGEFAFDGCRSLTSIAIPSSVTSIGNYAFEGCFSLASIDIPSNVTSIGYMAFSNCRSLASITVSAGNPVYDSREGCNAIIETSSNTLITGCQNTVIPSSVTSIGRSAFFYCTSLTSITIPSSVTSIGNKAFACCTSLTSISIPSSVTSIGDSAFSGCSSLASITVSAGNPVYDSREGCNAIIETSSNTLITGCQNTVIPSSVTSIGDSAFSGCTSLTSIDIPSSVKRIGDGAFYYCTSLTSIDIPSSVTSIEDVAFYYCYSLATVICRAEDVPELGIHVFAYVPSYATLYVPSSAVEAYKATLQWQSFDKILPLEDYETGISAPAAPQAGNAPAAPYYTPAGQRISAPARGGVYIRGGRKVIQR